MEFFVSCCQHLRCPTRWMSQRAPCQLCGSLRKDGETQDRVLGVLGLYSFEIGHLMDNERY